jgi:hypothetical protein
MRVSIGISSGGRTIRGRRLARFEHALERGEQAEQVDLDLRLVLVAGGLRNARIWTHELRAAQRLPIVQQLGGRFVFLMLQQPTHERLARILFRLVVLRWIGPLAAACAT